MSLISNVKEFIAIILFIISIITISGKEVDLSKVEVNLAEEITVETEIINIDFTNNTKKAIDDEITISSFKKLEGGDWVEIPLNDKANLYPASAKIWGDCYPGMTYRYSRAFGDITDAIPLKEGKYLLTLEYHTTSHYSLRQSRSTNLEFYVSIG